VEAFLVKSVVYTLYMYSETFHCYYLCCSWYRNSCQTVQNCDTKVYTLGTCHLEGNDSHCRQVNVQRCCKIRHRCFSAYPRPHFKACYSSYQFCLVDWYCSKNLEISEYAKTGHAFIILVQNIE